MKKMTRKDKIIILTIFIIFISTLLYHSFQTQFKLNEVILIAGHFIAYFMLSIYICLFLKCKHVKHCYSLAIVIATLFGICIEVCQFFIPGRCFEFTDIAYNYFGAVAGILMIKLCLRNKKC